MEARKIHYLLNLSLSFFLTCNTISKRITTHNNDCQECDFRITHVPARDWPAGSKRPLYDIRNAYPRYIEVPESKDGNIHGPDYIKSTNYPDKRYVFFTHYVFHHNRISVFNISIPT